MVFTLQQFLIVVSIELVQLWTGVSLPLIEPQLSVQRLILSLPNPGSGKELMSTTVQLSKCSCDTTATFKKLNSVITTNGRKQFKKTEILFI